MVKFKEVPVSMLRKSCPTSVLKFKTTDELEPTTDIIGQQRAIDSIQLGVEMPSKGYNIFITGLTGTGRKKTIQTFLKTKTETELTIMRGIKQLFDPSHILNPGKVI